MPATAISAASAAAIVFDTREQGGMLRPSADSLGTRGVLGAGAARRNANKTFPRGRRQEGDWNA